MPRYDDRYGGTRLYVGHLSSRTRSRDIEDVFSRYGRVRNVDLKHDFAFVDFSDPRDADDARHSLDGRDFDGSRIVVEFARGAPRGRGGSREYLGRGPAPGSGCCFNCGVDGHWARDCTAGDWRNKCYRCGERGHIERHCKSSPKSLRRGRSYSRSPSPHRGRGRSRSYSHSRSYRADSTWWRCKWRREESLISLANFEGSEWPKVVGGDQLTRVLPWRTKSRSRTPPRRGGRTVERDDRLRSPRYSKSPPLSKVSKRSLTPSGSRSPSPSKGRKRSPSPYGSRSPPPSKGRKRSLSPDVSRSPSLSKGRIRSPSPIGSRSPPPSKGRILSPSPNDGSGSPPMLKGQKRSSSPNDGGGSPPLSKGRKHSPSPYGSRSPPEQIVQDGSDYGESPKANGRMLSPGDDDMKYPRMGSTSP